MTGQRLYRSKVQRAIGGVAGGIAEFFDIDPVIIRITFIMMVLFGGSGVLIYLVLWIVIPEKPFDAQLFSAPPQVEPSDAQPVYDSTSYPPTPVQKPNKVSGGMIGGVILIAVGILALAGRYVSFVSFRDLWPAILIIVGVVFIVSALGQNKSGKSSDF